jgi:hypothetical protein
VVGLFMPDKSPHKVYPYLNGKRETLTKFREEAIQIGMDITSQKGSTVSNFVLIGIIKRSIDLVEGFIILLEDWNLICAAPIVRMQIDTLLRLNYLSDLDDPSEVFKSIFSGKQFNKIKDKKGKPLTDQHLREYAIEEFPWINDIYENTSKYIHLSGRHIFASICQIDEENHSVCFVVGNKSMHAKEKDLNSYYDVMIQISQGILKKLVKINGKKWDESEVGSVILNQRK